MLGREVPVAHTGASLRRHMTRHIRSTGLSDRLLEVRREVWSA